MASNIELSRWYPSSETAKRALGSIAQAVNERRERVGLLGTAEEPLLELIDVKLVPDDKIEPVDISIVDAKRDWPAVVWAALSEGSSFGSKARSGHGPYCVVTPTTGTKASPTSTGSGEPTSAAAWRTRRPVYPICFAVSISRASRLHACAASLWSGMSGPSSGGATSFRNGEA